MKKRYDIYLIDKNCYIGKAKLIKAENGAIFSLKMHVCHLEMCTKSIRFHNKAKTQVLCKVIGVAYNTVFAQLVTWYQIANDVRALEKEG